jgi:4-amino-4-deoxy-L-arabinose transferase-like glycosyltransferase
MRTNIFPLRPPAWATRLALPTFSGGAWREPSLAPIPNDSFLLAPPAPSGGAWGDASPQTPAKHSSWESGNLEMGDGPRPPHPPRPLRPLQAPRLSVTPAVSANADSLTSTLSTIGHTVFLAGVWGEASPQAPPEGAGGARERLSEEVGGERETQAGGASRETQAGGASREAQAGGASGGVPIASILYLAVYVFAFLVYAAVAWPHTHPPYIDSFYYVDIARNLAHGQGFSENFVWNYLGGTPSLPHPSSAYWLPGMSVLLAPVLALGGGYHGAALVTAATAALCPVLALRIGRDVFATWRHALTMAALTLFNGVWFHDWTTPDAFVLYAVLATATLLLAARGLQGKGPLTGRVNYAAAGFLAGLAALTRQEGVFLLLALLLGALITPGARRLLWPGGIVGAVVLFGGAEAPWTLHNLVAFGHLAPAGGMRALWMRSYDSFYALHTELLTARAYAGWGIAHILAARVNAALLELAVWMTLWFVVLVPPLLAGLWRLGRRVEYRPFLLYWAMLALALPLLFTATLEHGTLGHASGALVPFGSGLVVGGIDVLVRGKHRLSAMLRVAAVLCAVVVSLDMTWRTFPAHGDEYTHDARVAVWLHQHNPRGRPVLVLDPPLFAYLDGGAYVAAPSDGVASDLAVARRYGARYWVLDPLHAAAQDPLYRGQVHSPALRRVAVVDGAQVYRISSQ